MTTSFCKSFSVQSIPVQIETGLVIPRPYLRIRRAVECCVVLVMLPLFVPLFAGIACAVKCSSPGPVLYSQMRPGSRGRLFRLIKFRTMRCVAADQESLHDEHRITKVGRVLRRYHLDELPQLWNIVRGEMSLVGPRPHPVFADTIYAQNIEQYYLRYLVPPGITGLAQLCYGAFSDIDGARRTLQYDLYYISRLSWLLDIRILAHTIIAVARGRDAPRRASATG